MPSILTKMPMVKKRPTIDEGFRRMYVEAAGLIANDIASRALTSGPKNFFKTNKSLARTYMLTKSIVDANAVPDAVLTKLYTLPYTSFSGFKRRSTMKIKNGRAMPGDEQIWFVGTTNEVQFQMGTGYNEGATRPGLKAGTYFVYIPVKSFLNGSLGNIHLIPEQAPFACRQRHPHHSAAKKDKYEHPLDWDTNTCTGGFGTAFQVLAIDFDVPEAFRVLRFFVERVNTASILTYPPEMIPWVRKLNGMEDLKNANTIAP